MLGGELDFVSLTGADERGRVRAEYGSFGRQGLQAAVGGVGERWMAGCPSAATATTATATTRPRSATACRPMWVSRAMAV
jgi:hypothetical protein